MITIRNLLVTFLLSFVIAIQMMAESLYPGNSVFLAPPNPPRGEIFQTAWSSTSPYLSIEKWRNGAYVKVTEYFTGSAEVTCTSYYEWYDYSTSIPRRYQNTITKRYYITCLSVETRVSPTSLDLEVGGGYSLDVTLSPDISPTPSVRWWSDDPKVASVNASGYVRAVGEGHTYINVQSSASTSPARCYVSVKSVKPTKIHIADVLTVYVGESSSVSYEISPSNAQTSLSWKSRDTKVATVSDNSVYGVEEGTTTVYCMTANGLTSNDCSVSVMYRPLQGLKISDSELYVPIGTTKTLSWLPTPINAKKPSVTWTSSDEKVATVSQSGVVTGWKKGTATITVSTGNGYFAKCRVTVPPDPDKLTLPSKKISLYKGKTRKLSASVVPTDAYAKLSWKSSDTKVAIVSDDGTVTALYPGKAIITATSQNGVTASCQIEVPEPAFTLFIWSHSGEKTSIPLSENPRIKEQDGVIYVITDKEDIQLQAAELRKFTIADEFTNEIPSSISIPSSITLDYKEKKKIDYILYPLEYDIDATVSWKSSDTKVATVSSIGEILARDPGECQITATTSNGHSAVCDVVVLEHEAYLVLWQHSGEIVTYSLADKPRIKYSDGEFWVISDKTEIGYPQQDVRKFTLQLGAEDTWDTEDGIQDLQDCISYDNARPGSKVIVYDINGRMIDSYTVSADGNVRYTMENYPAGIYIVKTESTTIKIIKK